jgi:ElaB/YqjD/DUF883 family membrane-anchored ribosome-binding protein
MATIKTTTPKTPKKGASVTATTSANVVPMNSDIANQLETLRNDIKLLAKTVKDQALSTVENRKDTAKTVAIDQKEAAMAKYDELSTKAELQIREKPLTSMAIAVGAGIVLSAILRK